MKAVASRASPDARRGASMACPRRRPAAALASTPSRGPPRRSPGGRMVKWLKDDAAAGARHLHLLLRAAAHDQERHRQARGPGPRPVARPLLLDRSSPNHMMDIAAQNPLKITPALFPPSKDASFIAVAAPTASSLAGTPSTRTIISKQLVNLTQRPDPRRRRRDRLAHVDLHADVVRHLSFAIPQRRDEEAVPEGFAVLAVI